MSNTKKSTKSAKPSTSNAAKLERSIEQAAARGDRKLVEQLTAAPKAKAPKADALNKLEQRIETYLLTVAKEHTDAYAKSISRPLADFAVWCASKRITEVKHLNTHALELFRKHVQSRGNALSTSRMALARVQTFCRFAEVDADLSVLRLQHTEAEKEHLAALAAERTEEAV